MEKSYTEFLKGHSQAKNNIQPIFNVFPEMEFKKSFLMQDGAIIHTSNDVIDWLNFLWKDRWI